MNQKSRSAIVRFSISLGAVATALLLSLTLQSFVNLETPPFFFFSAAVMIAAFLGGFWPGMLATVLSALLSSFFFLAPIHSFRVDHPEQFARLTLFLMEGTLLSALSAALDSAKRKMVRRPALRYAISIIAVGTALLIKLPLYSLIDADVPFTMFYAAVMVSAWIAGFGPGIFATLLAALTADYFFIHPIHSLHMDSFPHVLRLVLFMLEGTLITYFSTTVFEERQRRRQLESEAQQQHLLLQESERRFRLLVDNVRNYSIYMLDPNGRVESWNAGAERMKGYKTEEVIGKHFSLFFTPEDRAQGIPEKELQKVLQEGTSHGALWRVRRDGTRFMAETSITAISNEKEKLEGFSVVIHDISQRLKSEDALKKSEEKLRQAQKMEAVGRLAGGIAHDFNNMLLVILGYSEMITSGLVENEEIGSRVGEIRRAAEHAAALTRQLLAFSRKQVLQPKLLDLNQLIRDNENLLRRLIGEDVIFETELFPHLYNIRADSGQMEQVLMNLAANARDAMPEGGNLKIATANVALSEEDVSAYSVMPPGSYVRIEVLDTGTGMDDSTKERIFEPFFTTKEMGQGTGLGLSTVYGIVKQSGGFIWVESETGKGTAFRIYFPPETKKAAEETAASSSTETMQGSETILVVEDEARVRHLICEILERKGYQVFEASGGKEALQLCARPSMDLQLLITDVMMPEMSGTQLAEKLQETHSGLRVLYMSGSVSQRTNSPIFEKSGAVIIQKPFSSEELLRQVRLALDTKL